MLPVFNKDCYLDHVAIAVSDLDRSVEIWSKLGLKFSDMREVVESQLVTTAFASIDEHAHIELLCPYGEGGTIKKFIEKNGEGIHHLCFKVPDVVKKMEELKANGFRFIYESAQPGANNCLVNFIHPKSTGGVLVEISQTMK